MLEQLRRSNYPAVGLSEGDWCRMSQEKRLKHAATLTEEQKSVIRRDYLYHHLTDRVMSIASVQGSLMLVFAKQHLPEQTVRIETTHKEAYSKKNARLDERIAALKKQAKTEAKTSK